MEVSNITTSTRIDQVDGFMQIEELQKIQNSTAKRLKVYNYILRRMIISKNNLLVIQMNIF